MFLYPANWYTPGRVSLPVGLTARFVQLCMSTAQRTKRGHIRVGCNEQNKTLRAVRIQRLSLLVAVPAKVVLMRFTISDPVGTRTSTHPTCWTPNATNCVHVLVGRWPCCESHPVEHIVLRPWRGQRVRSELRAMPLAANDGGGGSRTGLDHHHSVL